MKTEAELAAIVVRYLTDLGHDVHSEVVGPGGRADIVAVRGPVVHVVETKLSGGLAVLNQAVGWIGHAHRVSVAVPKHGTHRAAVHSEVFVDYCRIKGIGILRVRQDPEEWERGAHWYRQIEETVPPRLYRRANVEPLRRHLSQKTREYAPAGNADSKFWSPFKQTLERIEAALKATPGLTMRELIDAVKVAGGHHYYTDSSARQAIPNWVKNGLIKSIESVGAGKARRWYLRGQAPTPTVIGNG